MFSGKDQLTFGVVPLDDRCHSTVAHKGHYPLSHNYFKLLRADVCKYRPVVGKINISKNPIKIQWTTLGTLFMKI